MQIERYTRGNEGTKKEKLVLRKEEKSIEILKPNKKIKGEDDKRELVRRDRED